MFGKEILEPRLTCYYGDFDYKYSGKFMKGIPFADAPPVISVLKDQIEAQWEKEFGFKYEFNSVLRPPTYGTEVKFTIFLARENVVRSCF